MLLTLSILCALAAGILVGLAYGRNGQKAMQKALSEAQLEVTRQQTLLDVQKTQHEKESCFADECRTGKNSQADGNNAERF